MLSRILIGRAASEARSFDFPDVSTPYATPAHATATSGGEGAGAELAAARATIQRLEAEIAAARRQGYDAGRMETEQKARTELEAVMAKMVNAIAEVAGMRAEMRRRAEQDVVKLALLIAKRVLHRELTVDENAMTALARVAFETLARAEKYKVTVHPRFSQAIAAALPAGIASRVRIEPDPSREPGTLLIESPDGLTDASIDTQLEEIGRGLTDRLART
jgi:flagellar assembly protein FliH